jgi:hypothetical protein
MEDTMFGKQKVSVGATNAYLIELGRAALSIELAAPVILTQINLVSRDVVHPDLGWRTDRQYADRFRVCEMRAYLTSLSFPRRYGHEGMFPPLPEAKLKFVLSSETAGFVHWRIYRMSGEYSRCYEPHQTGHFEYIYGKTAPQELVDLEEELAFRRPHAGRD